MKAAASTAALLLLLAATAGAEEGAAPLAGTKKQLQQLQTDRADTGAPEAKDGLKTTAPALHLPASSAPRPSPEQQQRLEKQRSEARKNWLIDGVTKLEGENGTKAILPGEGEPEEAGEDAAAIVDTTDPAYLLKLYDKQKTADDAKSAQNKEQRASRPDAFAPFLKDWMAASPVKDQLLGDLMRQNGGATAVGGPVAAGAPAGVRGTAALPDFNREPLTPVAMANPYLVDSAPAVLAPPAPLLTAPGGTLSSAPIIGVSPPVAPGMQPLAEPATSDRKAPPPPLADDKKYFPQLNRF